MAPDIALLHFDDWNFDTFAECGDCVPGNLGIDRLLNRVLDPLFVCSLNTALSTYFLAKCLGLSIQSRCMQQ